VKKAPSVCNPQDKGLYVCREEEERKEPLWQRRKRGRGEGVQGRWGVRQSLGRLKFLERPARQSGDYDSKFDL
jgi:hypothetical protein